MAMYLDVKLIEAKDLLAMDSNGLSDPYCKVTVCGKTQKSKVVKKSLNPKWNMTLGFTVKDPAKDKVVIEVLDKDFFGSDSIGTVELTIEDLVRRQEKTQWVKLNNKQGRGEIHVGLTAVNWGKTAASTNLPSSGSSNDVLAGMPPPQQQQQTVSGQPPPQVSNYPSYAASGAQQQPQQQQPPNMQYGMQSNYYQPPQQQQQQHPNMYGYGQPMMQQQPPQVPQYYQQNMQSYSNPYMMVPLMPSPGNYGQPQQQNMSPMQQMLLQQQQQQMMGGMPPQQQHMMMQQSPVQSPMQAPHHPQPSQQTGETKRKLGRSAMDQGFNIDYSEITFIKKIGTGGFGEVWLGEWAGTNAAIKKILKHDISEADLSEFSHEIMLMSKLRHPNVVQFLGACFEPEFCLLTEFMDRGSLFHVLQDPKYVISWHRKLEFAKDIAKGILYLHTRTPAIVHRDIKSLNVLVTKEWKCTITDFGLTKIKEQAMLSTRCGSPAWSAPEVLRGEPYNESADVFSYGIVIWEIINRQPPYQGMNPMQLIGQVAYQKPGLRPPIPECPIPQLVSLMVRSWDDNPHMRPTFKQILDELKLIELSPEEMTVSEVPPGAEVATPTVPPRTAEQGYTPSPPHPGH